MERQLFLNFCTHSLDSPDWFCDFNECLLISCIINEMNRVYFFFYQNIFCLATL